MASTFSEYLDHLLTERRLSLREFSRKAGMSHTALSLVKSGKRGVPLARIDAWADLLELTGRHRERFVDLAELTHVPMRLRNLVMMVEKAAGKPLRDLAKELR